MSNNSSSSLVNYQPTQDQSLIDEIALLSGRVDLLLRLVGRIISKMDPAWIEPEIDPERKRRSQLLGESVIQKAKAEALAQAEHDPEQFARLKRYFKDVV